MRRYRILVADRDPSIIRLVRANLEPRDYETIAATDGHEVLQVVKMDQPDMLLMEMVLPGIDGLELCSRIRRQYFMPIVVFGENGNEENKFRCFERGADDYLSKPFSTEELLARIRAIRRRTEPFDFVQGPQAVVSGDLQIEFSNRKVTLFDREISLTPTEFDILRELAVNHDKVVTHSFLLRKIWGPEYGNEREYLRVFIGRLRKKIEPDPRKPHYIRTLPWIGYKFTANPEPCLNGV